MSLDTTLILDEADQRERLIGFVALGLAPLVAAAAVSSGTGLGTALAAALGCAGIGLVSLRRARSARTAGSRPAGRRLHIAADGAALLLQHDGQAGQPVRMAAAIRIGPCCWLDLRESHAATTAADDPAGGRLPAAVLADSPRGVLRGLAPIRAQSRLSARGLRRHVFLLHRRHLGEGWPVLQRWVVWQQRVRR